MAPKKQKSDVVKNSPFMNVLCDAAFFTSTILSLVLFNNLGYMRNLLLSIVGTVLVIRVVTVGSGKLGALFSSTILSGKPFNDPLGSRITNHKFTAQFWQLAVHVAMALFEWYILKDEQWLQKPQQLAPWTKLEGRKEKESVYMLYIVQAAIWIVTGISHRFIEEKHKDYYVTYLHHGVTLAIVTYSLYAGYLRFGVVVFWMHDLSDVFLDILKLSNLLKLGNREGYFVTETSYIILMVFWIYERLYMLPRAIIVGVFGQLDYDHVFDDGTTSYCKIAQVQIPEEHDYDCRTGYVIAVPLLCALLCMHIWWTWLLLRIGYRSLIVGEDTSAVGKDEYEGDSGDEKTKRS